MFRPSIRRIYNIAGQAFKDARAAEEKHAEATSELWMKLSMFVAFPALTLTTYYVVKKEMAHLSHYERPEFKAYEHMRIRKKAFPWGDGTRSLFHNPKYNALADGYEE